MLSSSRPGRPRTVCVLRGLALLFLAVNYALYFRDSLFVPAAGTAWLLGLASAFLLDRSGLRLPFAFGCVAILTFLLREAGLAAIRVSGVFAGTEAADLAALAFDRHWWLLVPVFAVTAVLTLLHHRIAAYRRTEAAVQGGLLVAVFWAQGGFGNTLYPHPLFFALSVSAFILLEIFRLYADGPTGLPGCTEPVRGGGARRNRWPASLVPLALALGLLLSWIFGRYGEAAVSAGGGLLKPSLFRFDFSNYLTLESEIRQTRDLVLLYRRDRPIDRHLLRRFVLDGYRPGTGFFLDPKNPLGNAAETVPDHRAVLPLRETEGRDRIGQELYLVNLDPAALLSVDYPVETRPVRNWKKSSFVRIYRAEAMASYILPFELADAKGPGMSPELLEYYTRYGGDEKIRALALKIVGRLPGYYDRVQVIHDHLKYEYRYSLRPGVAADGNQLDHFLFGSKKGYCSYFAFSMALLCRSLGIPARVAVGFFLDPQSELLGFHPVRADMAHAWVEVYFGRYGWIDFDPTSETPAPGEEYAQAPGFDKDKLASLLEEIIANRIGAEEEKTEPPPESTAGRDGAGGLLAALKRILDLWPAVAAAAALALYLGLRFSDAAAARLSRSPRRRTTAAFRALLRDLAALGTRKRKTESLPEFVVRAGKELGVPLDAALELIQKARFDRDFTAEDEDRFRSELRRVRAASRSARPTSYRLRYLHPRGLGRLP